MLSFNTMKHLVAKLPLDIFKEIAEIYHCKLYLTGGSVRDLLLNREIKDWDITSSGDIKKIADAFSKKVKGKLIILDEVFQTYRIIKRGIIFDFTLLRGDGILEDLRHRDYTINALAIDLLNPVSIIDPLGGVSDLKRRRIHLISPSALCSDPLRILRAFRIAAELNFSIDEYTISSIKEYIQLLDRVAKERIRQELDLLFSTSKVSYWLSQMGDLGIFKVILPEIEALKGITQNGFHHLDVYEHSLLTLAYIEEILDNPARFFSYHLDIIRDYLKGSKHNFYLKWAALCHDIGKPACKGKKGSRITFYRHDQVGARIFSNMVDRLRFSKKDKEAIALLILNHMRPFYLLKVYKEGSLSTRAVHRLIRAAGPHTIGTFLLAMADSLASAGEEKPNDYEEHLKALFNHVMDVYKSYLRIKERPRLVTGHDIREWFNLPPCPKVGILLRELERAQISGEVSTREEARAWLERKFKCKI